MTWTCPNNNEGHCLKRKARCEPAAEGCVIGRSFALMTPSDGDQGDVASSDASSSKSPRENSVPAQQG